MLFTPAYQNSLVFVSKQGKVQDQVIIWVGIVVMIPSGMLFSLIPSFQILGDKSLALHSRGLKTPTYLC